MVATGIDFGKVGDDRTTMTVNCQELWWVGMPVRMADQTNRYRTVIVDVLSATSIEIKTYIRPSRGFARHNRRIKQARRSRQ